MRVRRLAGKVVSDGSGATRISDSPCRAHRQRDPGPVGSGAGQHRIRVADRGWQRRPELQLLKALAKRLGTTPEALLSGDPDLATAKVFVALDHAELALRGGRIEDARTSLSQLEPDLLRTESSAATGRWRYLTALVAEARGELDDAIVSLEDLVVDRAYADRTMATIALSRCYRESGDLARAVDVGERCLESLRELGLDGSDDAVQLAVTVAAAHVTRGDRAHALRLCTRVLEAQDGGTPIALAAAYWNARAMESERGAPEAAIGLAQKALVLLQSAEGSRNLARLRSQIVMIQLRLDPPELESAKENLRAAAAQFVTTSASTVDRGRNDVAFAQAKLLEGDAAQAYRDAARALDAFRSTAPLLAVGALTVMGQAASEQRNGAAAADAYREAVNILSGIGSDRAASEAWFELGFLLDDLGLERDAHDAFRSAAASTGLTSAYSRRFARS